MAGMEEELRLADLNEQVFGNPLILRNILEKYVTKVNITNPEPASVHHLTFSNHKGIQPEAPCRRLITEHGNLLKQVNTLWEKFTIEIFTEAHFPLNQIGNGADGLRKLQEETHVPFAMEMWLPNQHTENIFKVGNLSLVKLQLHYSKSERMWHVLPLPQSFPAVRELSINCPEKLCDFEQNWQQFVQNILDKCANLKEVKVVTTVPYNDESSNWTTLKIQPWKYPVSIKHLMLTDLYLPPVNAPALKNLVSLRIYFSRNDAELHDKFVALLIECKDSLQELILTGPQEGRSRIGILSLPVLQNLRTLMTNQRVLLSDAEQGRGLEGKVPLLEHLALEWSVEYHFEEDLCKGWIGHCQTQPLDSVTRFSWNISNDPLSRDQLLEKLPVCLPQLNAMLPNLTRLEIRLPDLYLSGLSLVFGEMVQLTSLKIDVWNKKREIDSNLQTSLWESLLIGENAEQAGLSNLKQLEMVSFGSYYTEGHSLSLRAITAGLLPVVNLKKLILRGDFMICSEAAKTWKERGFELIVIRYEQIFV